MRDLVRATFGKQNIEITREGELTAAEIDAKKLIDQHYYSIASKATILKPAAINVPGAPWRACRVASQFCRQLISTFCSVCVCSVRA